MCKYGSTMSSFTRRTMERQIDELQTQNDKLREENAKLREALTLLASLEIPGECDPPRHHYNGTYFIEPCCIKLAKEALATSGGGE